MQRNLRQANPLSSVLFVIIGEPLSRILSTASKANLISGFQVANSASSINYLQFANDTFIFCAANVYQVKSVKASLLCFEVVSGLKVNFFKRKLVGIRVEASLLSRLANLIGCKVGSFPMSYLGQPLCIGAASKSTWIPVLERVERKSSWWKARHLSMGGHLTLSHSALANLLLYFMSIFKCSLSVIKRNDKLCCDFLRHGENDNRKFHLDPRPLSVLFPESFKCASNKQAKVANYLARAAGQFQ